MKKQSLRSRSSSGRKRIFIVEDHPVFCDGMTTLFNNDPGLQVCGTAISVDQAVSALDAAHPDLLIVDVGLPGKSGLELIAEASAKWPSLPILVVSMADEALYARRALRAGAKGYLMKHEPPDRMLQAVHQVLAGKSFISTRLMGSILKTMPSRGIAEPAELLSPRERDILRLLGDGKNTMQIAKELGISAKTVASYRDGLKQKLGIADSHELVCYAIRSKLVEPAAPNIPHTPPQHQ